MGTPKQTLHPFAEMFEATTNGTSNVTVWDIPKGTIINLVLAKIKTAGTTAGNIVIGDAATANAYILSADAAAAADTIYGDIPSERGVYIRVTGDSACGAGVKCNTAAATLIMDCDAALTTEAVVDVYVFGWRYYED